MGFLSYCGPDWFQRMLCEKKELFVPVTRERSSAPCKTKLWSREGFTWVPYSENRLCVTDKSEQLKILVTDRSSEKKARP